MNLSDLHSTSSDLLVAVRDAEARLVSGVTTPISLIEIITLPDYGQRVILRFKVDDDRPFPSSDGDALESRLRDLAGPDYWVTVVETDDAPDYDMAARLVEIDRAFPDCLLQFPRTSHSEFVRQDAQTVREVFGLPEEYRVWEIEVPVSDATAPLMFRIVDTGEEGEGLSSRRESGPVDIDGVACEVVTLRDNPSFRGCLKAYFAASERQMALGSLVAQFPEVPTPSA